MFLMATTPVISSLLQGLYNLSFHIFINSQGEQPGCEVRGYQCVSVNVCMCVSLGYFHIFLHFPLCCACLFFSLHVCVCVRAYTCASLHVCVITRVYAVMDRNLPPGFVHM